MVVLYRPPFSKGFGFECPNGHHVGTFNRDVGLGETIKAEDIDWGVLQGCENGEELRCKVCGIAVMQHR